MLTKTIKSNNLSPQNQGRSQPAGLPDKWEFPMGTAFIIDATH
jgi:hypothetical protein